MEKGTPTMKKWVIGIIIILLLLCCGITMAERSGTIDGKTWTLSNDGVLTISGKGSLESYSTRDIWAPATVSIVIKDGITNIGDSAFSGFSRLTSILIPNSVTSIGQGAFMSCSSLTSIIIPDSVTNIGSGAFIDCSSLTNISIPKSVTSIGDAAFSYCSSLTSINIPESVTSIGGSAFEGCSNLTSIKIPKGVTKIADCIFLGCNNLTSISIPEGVTSIGDGAFDSCSNLTSISFPESLTSIGSYAFIDCNSLKSITIPDSVTNIGNNAFSQCNRLKKAYFAIRHTDVEVTFGQYIFGNERPTIYCYVGTAPYIYFLNDGRYDVVGLDATNPDAYHIITLQDDIYLACGDTIDLDYNVFPNDGKPIIWTSSNPNLLTVTEGTVTVLKPGKVTVTASIGQDSASMTINTYATATGLVLNTKEAWLQNSRENIYIEVAQFVPENAWAKLTWSSSDTTLATVSDGYVTTLRPGDVTITATTEKGVTASCLLHLTYPVTSVVLEPSAGKLFTGEKLQLTATVETTKGTYKNKLVDRKLNC